MNGFADHGLDEAAFGENRNLASNLRTFDAFRTYHILSFTFGMRKHTLLRMQIIALP